MKIGNTGRYLPRVRGAGNSPHNLDVLQNKDIVRCAGALSCILRLSSSEAFSVGWARLLCGKVGGLTGFALLTPRFLQVMEKHSACLSLPNERAVGIASADHRSICKFEDIDSDNYLLVLGEIRSISDNILFPSLDFFTFRGE